MDEYKIRMRYDFAVQRPKMFTYTPKIEPLVFKRSLKEKFSILKRIGIFKFIKLWRIEKALTKRI